jgi:hypothetical protein
MKTELKEIYLIAKAIKLEEHFPLNERLKRQCDRIEELCIKLDNPEPKTLNWKMKTYYKISSIVMVSIFAAVLISTIILGGESIVLNELVMFIAIVTTNFLVAMILFVRDIITGTIKI